MAAPTISIVFNDAGENTPNWVDIPDTVDVLTFTGPDTVAGTMDPITRPAAGVRVADELWVDKGTDIQVAVYDGGGQEVGDFVTDVFTADPVNTNVMGVIMTVNPETSPGILRAWDDTNWNTVVEESIAGTVLHVESFWRAGETASNETTGQTASGSFPGGYVTQTANTTTFALEGTTYQLTFSLACAAGNMNRFVIHLLIPEDADNPAQAARTIELTYHFFYT